MKIAIRVDGAVAIGTGHFARCLTLAAAVRTLGGEAHFVCRQITNFMRTQLVELGFGLSLLPPREEPFSSDLAHAAWLGVSQESDARDTIEALADNAPWDWLVVDHYGLDADWESRLRAVTKCILAIDDLADRKHDADALLDQNLQTINRYRDLVPENSKLMLGPKFALLRPEFRFLREAGIRPGGKVRINIFFGGTDPKGMTLVALEALRHFSDTALILDVVVGIDNPRHGIIAGLCDELRNTTLHLQPSNMGEILSSAHLALGAGGTTSWERCCLGLPSLIVSVAENQRDGSRALAKAGAAVDLGPMESVEKETIFGAVAELLARPDFLAGLRRNARALVDGRGAERVALYMARETVELRDAVIDDAEAKLLWRNDPRTCQYFNDPRPVPLPNHLAWWDAALHDEERTLLIAHYASVDVGVLRFDFAERTAIVSVYLDPELKGLGLGSAVLRAGNHWLRILRPDIKTVRADIHPSNSASANSFCAAGFRNIADRQWVCDLYG